MEENIYSFSKKIRVKLRENDFCIQNALKSMVYVIYSLENDLVEKFEQKVSEQLMLLKKQDPKALISVAIDFRVKQLTND